MKRLFFFFDFALILFSCSVAQDRPSQDNPEFPVTLCEGEVIVTIDKSSKTRTNGAEAYSISCKVEDDVYETTAECFAETPELSFVNHCSLNGETFARLVFFKGELVSVDLVDEDEVETRGNRKPGEKFNDCCVRTYRDIREGLENRNPALCEFEPKICVVTAVVIAAAGCVRVQSENNE